MITLSITSLAAGSLLMMVGGVIFGWTMGADRKQKLLTEEVKEEFMKRYYEKFKANYEKAVMEEAQRIVNDNLDAWYDLIRQELKEGSNNETVRTE